MKRNTFNFPRKNPVWMRILTLALILFFVILSDAILSFWVPTYFEKVYGSTTIVGLIMSFSSIVGLVADLILPQIIKGLSVRKLTIFGIISSIFFSLFLLQTTYNPILFFTLISMAIWGIYYEILNFAQQQFVADSTPLKFHPAAWGILGVFKSLAYFIGPFIAAFLLKSGDRDPVYVAICFTLISFLMILIYGRKHDRPLEIDTTKVNVFKEIEHWTILFKHVWPVVILSLILGLIDAMFWTIGPIWSKSLAETSILGGMFVSIYVLPSLFMGFLVAKWGVYKGKKRLAYKLFIVSAILLALLGISSNIYWQILFVFLSSSLLAFVYPLVDGVYSDIISRLGRERHHMIGLTSSAFSLSYIIGPPLSGYIAQLAGEKTTFTIFGIVSVLIVLILYFATPKKLIMPQKEIQTWR